MVFKSVGMTLVGGLLSILLGACSSALVYQGAPQMASPTGLSEYTCEMGLSLGLGCGVGRIFSTCATNQLDSVEKPLPCSNPEQEGRGVQRIHEPRHVRTGQMIKMYKKKVTF